MCYSPELRQDKVTEQRWGRDGKANGEDFLEEGGGMEVRSIFGRRESWIEMGGGFARAWWEGKFGV